MWTRNIASLIVGIEEGDIAAVPIIVGGLTFHGRGLLVASMMYARMLERLRLVCPTVSTGLGIY